MLLSAATPLLSAVPPGWGALDTLSLDYSNVALIMPKACAPGSSRNGMTGRCNKPCAAGKARNSKNVCQVAPNKQRGPRGPYKKRATLNNQRRVNTHRRF